MSQKFYATVDLVQNPLQNAALHPSASAPGTPVEGQVYHNTTDHFTYVYNGTTWVSVENTGPVSFTDVIITGTAGAGYLELPEQSSNPGTPTNAVRVFVDASNRLSWKGENSYVRTFDGTANTADRVYVLPDISGTILVNTAQIITTLTTEQMRLRYDGSNYASFTISSTGGLTIASTGASATTLTIGNGTNALFSTDGRLALNGSSFSDVYSIFQSNANITIPGSATDRILHNLSTTPTISTANQTGQLQIANIGATVALAGFTVSTVRGILSAITAAGSGIITTADVWTAQGATSGTATITTLRNINIASASAGGGAITSVIGIAVASQTAATNNTYMLLGTSTAVLGNWTIHATTTNDSALAGRLSIGKTTAPAGILDIVGLSDQVQLTVTGFSTQTSVLQSWRNSTPTIVASISNLGHVAFGTATAPSANTIMATNKTFADPSATTFAGDFNISTTYTGANAQTIIGMRGVVSIIQTGGNATGTVAGRGLHGVGAAAGTTNTVTGVAGVYARVDNTAAGTLTNGYGVYVDTAVNSGSGTFTNNYGVYVVTQTVGGSNYAIFTNAGGRVSVVGGDTISSAAGATWKGIEFRAATATITGSTNITTTTGFNYIDIARPTLGAGTALTVTNAATVYIANSPLGGGAGPATITNAYSLWIDAGVARFDGNLDFSVSDTTDFILGTGTGTKFGTATTQKLGFYNKAPVVQQTDGAALTNNVTSGGTTDTIANYTDLTTYATDAAAIRNNIYQLARKVKIVDDALRLYGLLS